MNMQRGAFSRWTLADAEILNDFYGDDIFQFSVSLNPLSGLAGAVKVQVECFGMRLVKGEKNKVLCKFHRAQDTSNRHRDEHKLWQGREGGRSRTMLGK